jgi:hypothetical protein
MSIPDVEVAVALVRRIANHRRRRLDQRSSTEETLIFIGATTAHVQAVDAAGPRVGRIIFFGEDFDGLLFIGLSYPVHETGRSELFSQLFEDVRAMRVQDKVVRTDAEKYASTRGSAARKECSMGFRPDPRDDAVSNFPSLAIEARNWESCWQA